MDQCQTLLGAADIFEFKDTLFFKVDVPGLTKADIKVRVADGNLQVTGARVHETSDANYLHSERQFGHFSRVFKLPVAANLAKISAVCDHGVLTISVPKAGETQPALHEHVAVASAEEEGDGALNTIFASVPVSVFPTPALGKLVVLESTMSLAEALRTLAQYKILAAPVLDVTKPIEASWTERYPGFLDMVTIVFHMLEKLHPDTPPEDFEKEVAAVAEFNSTTVGDALKFSQSAPFVPLDAHTGTLLDAMLLCGQHALRRVPVIKTGTGLVNVVTQSALVQTLAANLPKFSAVSHKTLIELGLGSPATVHSVRSDQKLRAAFQLIKQHDISAVPVLDSETGQICGNVSARDVRLIATSTKVYKLLNMPIRLYLDVVSDGAANSAITCKPEDTMETVITRLVHSRIHRIYVVDGEDHIIRVVSLRNVLRKFVKEPQGFFGTFFN